MPPWESCAVHAFHVWEKQRGLILKYWNYGVIHLIFWNSIIFNILNLFWGVVITRFPLVGEITLYVIYVPPIIITVEIFMFDQHIPYSILMFHIFSLEKLMFKVYAILRICIMYSVSCTLYHNTQNNACITTNNCSKINWFNNDNIYWSRTECLAGSTFTTETLIDVCGPFGFNLSQSVNILLTS